MGSEWAAGRVGKIPPVGSIFACLVNFSLEELMGITEGWREISNVEPISFATMTIQASFLRHWVGNLGLCFTFPSRTPMRKEALLPPINLM